MESTEETTHRKTNDVERPSGDKSRSKRTHRKKSHQQDLEAAERKLDEQLDLRTSVCDENFAFTNQSHFRFMLMI